MSHASVTPKLNPYVAGNPVGGGEAFVGRSDVLREVLRILHAPHENALVLYGQRRIGKTSVLQQLVAGLAQEGPYRPVYFDLQDKVALPLGTVIQKLTRCIAHELGMARPGTWGGDIPSLFRADFLPRALSHLPPDTSLVLLFDEFDVLDEPPDKDTRTAFFHYLRELLTIEPQRLKFIFVIGRRPEDLSSLTLSVFKGARSFRVSLMPPDESAELIRLAERNQTLRWPDEAVAHVQKLTSGHPFLTQQLCQMVWENAYREEPHTLPTVRRADIEAAIPAALEGANHSLEWLWKGLHPAERVVAAALAQGGAAPITKRELELRLMDSGLRVYLPVLEDAHRVLQEWDLIRLGDEGYRFPVELLRLWIAKRKPLNRVWEEIEHIDQVANNLYLGANGLSRAGKLAEAIQPLRQAIGLNPNHLRANLLLAEILLAQGEIGEARTLLETLYEYHPAAARPRLVQALLLQAQAATDEDERLALYDLVLDRDPIHPEASSARHRIWEQRGDEALRSNRLKEALHAYRKAGLHERAKELEIRLAWLEIGRLERVRDYQTALDIARALHRQYPQDTERLPDLALLERKTTLPDLYQKALVDLQLGHLQQAQKRLAEIVSLEPSYEDAASYLHKSVTGVDVGELKQQVAREQEARVRAEALMREAAFARQQAKAETRLLAEARQEAESVAEQAATARTLAETSAQQERMRRQQLESEVRGLRELTLFRPPLSSLNPLDYLSLLWWLFMAPQRLTAYERRFGPDSIQQVGKWLASALTWLPLLVLSLALGTGGLPSNALTWPFTTYLSLTGGGMLMWLVTGWLGDDENELERLLVGGVAGGAALGGALMMAGGVDSSPSALSALCLALGVALSVAGVVALALELTVASGVALGVAVGMAMGIVGGVVGLQIGIVGGIVAAGVMGIVAGIIAGGVTGGLASGVKDGQARESATWRGRGLLLVLTLAYLFLLWYAFLGGVEQL